VRPQATAPRAARGGGYNNSADAARAGYRNHIHPGNDNNTGVRLVRVRLPHPGPDAAEPAAHHGAPPEPAGPEMARHGSRRGPHQRRRGASTSGPRPGLRPRRGPPFSIAGGVVTPAATFRAGVATRPEVLSHAPLDHAAVHRGRGPFRLSSVPELSAAAEQR